MLGDGEAGGVEGREASVLEREDSGGDGGGDVTRPPRR